MKKTPQRYRNKKPSQRRNWKSAAVYLILLLTCSFVVGYAVRAYNRQAAPPMTSINSLAGTRVLQSAPPARNEVLAKLASNPEPDRMRLHLGQRFLVPGKEISTITGKFISEGDKRTVSITRDQHSDGEYTTLAFNDGSGPLSWDGHNGARAGTSQATSEDRLLVERATLDSPDQFVLAQLRGAAYYRVARNVSPADADENYEGAVWAVVRVSEPDGGTLTKSPWRMYYINSVTGLIDRVISREEDVPVVAEFSEWTSFDGEMMPGRIVWTRGGEIVLEFILDSVGFSSAQ